MSKITNFFTKSLNAKLITLFLSISLIPIIIIGILGVKNSHDALRETEFHQLQVIGKLKTDEVTNYLNNKFSELGVLSKSEDAKTAFFKLQAYHNKVGTSGNEKFSISNPEYEKIYSEIDPFFKVFQEAFYFYDVLVICAEHGHVMYSADRKSDLGANLKVGSLKSSGLAQVWNSVIDNEDFTMVDFSYYEPSKMPAAFIGAPIKSESGETLAIIAVELDVSKINDIMQLNSEETTSLESYLIGDDFLMRSDSQLDAENNILKTKVDTESSRLAFQEKEGVHDIVDYRGIPVLSYYSSLHLKDTFGTNFDWAIVSEVDQDEAFRASHILQREITIIAIIIGIIVLIIAILFTRQISKPILKLTDGAQAIALGDLSTEFEIKNEDEIGVLANAFKRLQQNMRTKAEQAVRISEGNLTIKVEPLSEKDEMGKAFKLMVSNLKEQIDSINEVVSILTSSNSQLMSTIAELSSSSNETATTVSEITTTISEVKQTAEVSAQKAQSVSNTAQKSVQISEKGIASTEDSIEGMNNIHQQVKQIADTIIKLSEQSQTIGDITNSVNDLAEQSNLLALNASIEAVKAGEYGKGFGVVAQEIRALADQSKQATRQIRNILSEVQKAISSAVMATEEGGKAVDKGMQLTEDSGDSISMLADSIAEASQASTQIAASSQQQLTGMEQLATAMENIKTAATQNATGAKQAEEAVGNIKTIVENLNGLIGKYKLK